MVKSKEYSIFEKGKASGMLEAVVDIDVIMNKTGMSESTVKRLKAEAEKKTAIRLQKSRLLRGEGNVPLDSKQVAKSLRLSVKIAP